MAFSDARIFIVDDQRANVDLLQALLRGFGWTQLRGTTEPREALPLYAEFRPDLILLDIVMPGLDGFGVLNLLRPLLPEGGFLPIVVLTADPSRESRRRALGLGATDFINKPFDAEEVRLRIDNLLNTRFLYLRLQQQAALFEQQVVERTRALDGAQAEVLDRLGRVAEFRDDQTGEHTLRVGRAAAVVAATLGLDGREVELIRRAAPLHDIGKIGVPDAVLLKPGALTEPEMAQMREHTTLGLRILAGGQSDLMKLAEEVALYHHEWWDGNGYPFRLQGATIPIAARVVTVVDVYDALIHERPYKHAWPHSQALAHIERQAGVQFDPEVVRAFLEAVRVGRL